MNKKSNSFFSKCVIICSVAVLLSVYPICRGIHFLKHHEIVKKNRIAKETLVEKYLFGKNGIEIGGHYLNDFHLYEHGAYVNVDFTVEDFFDQGNGMRRVIAPGQVINVVASGDNLPFKDNTFDYVFNSHVMEHFFDPIKAIKEHLRVIKKGGYLLYIIPYVDVIYDKGRDITDVDELVKRHNGKLKISDYYMIDRKWDNLFNNTKYDTKDTGMKIYSVLKNKIDTSKEDYFTNNVGNKIKKRDLKVFKEDTHHHWNVWRPQDFVALAQHIGLKIVELSEKDSNDGKGFVVVIQK